MRRNRNKRHQNPAENPIVEAQIESLDQEGRGVAHVNGKTIFIDGALPNERVTYQAQRIKPSYEVANVIEVLQASPDRVQPQCPHFGLCGGCKLQHMESGAQIAAKQKLLEADLWHIGKVKAQNMLPPLVGPSWGYRHKARLSVKYVDKKQRVLVGFNEKATRYVADMNSCEVLVPRVSALIAPLQDMIFGLSLRDQLPQIELAVGEGDVIVLILRIMAALTADDETQLKAFADAHQVQIWTQTKGPDTIKPFYPINGTQLQYSLPEFDLVYPFKPNEFTQVNPQINREMVSLAMQLLQPQAHEKIADFFCGIGNFTLPIARSGAQVLGLEGLANLVDRANESAALNGFAISPVSIPSPLQEAKGEQTKNPGASAHIPSPLQGEGKGGGENIKSHSVPTTSEKSVTFGVADLFKMTPESLAELGQFDKWLIDPPRDGAFELVQAITPATAPKRIVYVSCNPATLARDAGVLVNEKGYTLVSAGVMNMFPHTAHVESIALFERP